MLAGVATAAFVVSAVGFALQAGWWPVAMLAASSVSLVLMIGWFRPWWVVGIALSGGLGVFAWQSQPVT